MSTVQFINNLSSTSPPAHTHDHASSGHTHDHGDHGHTHEHLDNPGDSPCHLRRSFRFANPRLIQESTLNENCPTFIQEVSRSEGSQSVSEGKRSLQLGRAQSDQERKVLLALARRPLRLPCASDSAIRTTSVGCVPTTLVSCSPCASSCGD